MHGTFALVIAIATIKCYHFFLNTPYNSFWAEWFAVVSVKVVIFRYICTFCAVAVLEYCCFLEFQTIVSKRRQRQHDPMDVAESYIQKNEDRKCLVKCYINDAIGNYRFLYYKTIVRVRCINFISHFCFILSAAFIMVHKCLDT